MKQIKNKIIKKVLDLLFMKSLGSAARERGLEELKQKLRVIVTDIRNQYSSFKLDNYLENKVRNMHAFQMSLVNRVIREFQEPVIVDIGDSAGTHIEYILGLYSGYKKIKCFSVNLDKEAVERIKKKGLNAIYARAEELHLYNVNADIFLCFETLEHMMSPCNFLHDLSSKTNAKYLIITVPYVPNSRVGMHHIRNKREDEVSAENTHIFELDPEDWKLLIKHSGWRVNEERIYLQYPKKSILRFTKYLWEKFDYEGFYGLILERDETYSSKYLDW